MRFSDGDFHDELILRIKERHHPVVPLQSPRSDAATLLQRQTMCRHRGSCRSRSYFLFCTRNDFNGAVGMIGWGVGVVTPGDPGRGVAGSPGALSALGYDNGE